MDPEIACVGPGESARMWSCNFFAFDGAGWYVRDGVLAVRMTGPPMGRPYEPPMVMGALLRSRGSFVEQAELEPARDPKFVHVGPQRVRRDLFEIVQALWPSASWRTHVSPGKAAPPVLAFESSAPGVKLVAVLAPVVEEGSRDVATSR